MGSSHTNEGPETIPDTGSVSFNVVPPTPVEPRHGPFSARNPIQRLDTQSSISTDDSDTDGDNEEQQAYRQKMEDLQIRRGFDASEYSLPSSVSQINITDDDYDNDGVADTIQAAKKGGFWTRMGRRIKENVRMVGELSSVREDIQRALKDEVQNPEVGWEGTVRRENTLCEDEKKFRQKRKEKIAAKLKVYLELDEDVHPDDVPCIGLGGSGGGFKAMLGFLGTIAATKESGEWDLFTYVAGVSGSCWAIASYYTFGELDIARTIAHYGRHSKHHPLASHAILSVLRSKDGPFHAFGPLLLKEAAGLKPHGMDLYGSFITSWCWLPSREEAQQVWGKKDQRIKREWTKWSSTRKWVDEGQEPLGVFTAVRHERPWQNWATKEKPFADTDYKSTEHKKARDAWYQWFEFTCYEVGCDEVTGWVPTWAFGRKFDALKSQQRLPEHSLALILGITTSAPAGPLSIYLEELQRNIPKGFLGNMAATISGLVANHWGPEEVEKFKNQHPVQASEVWNFLHNAQTLEHEGRDEDVVGLEGTQLIDMIDSGMDNNTPTYVFAHPSRDVDVCISFDASTDVKEELFPKRLEKFAAKKGLQFEKRSVQPPAQPPPQSTTLSMEAQAIYDKYAGQYAQVYDGVPLSPPETEGGEPKRSKIGVPQAVRKMTQVYVPLLPNARQPEYDPMNAKFSGVSNLVWSQDQVNMIVKTAKANWFEGRLAFRQVIREAYEERKAARLAGKPRLP